MPPNSHGSPRGVLVVEDNALNSSFLCRYIHSLGYAVVYAQDGQEALEFLAANQGWTGLIFLDLRMPRMDGFEFRSRQRRDPQIASIPVVILSAEGDAADCASLDAVALAKPLQLIKIQRTLRQWLGAPDGAEILAAS